jgi:HD-GYP domain-containing protein (c-di-GMP phosphodiesterase class II)
MRWQTKAYVATVALIALFWGALNYMRGPMIAESTVMDALLLCALATTAELLCYLLPRSATGSFGFVPYFAMAIIVPAWPSVAGVVLVKATVEALSHKPVIKAVLNVSAHALMQLIVISVYLALGGIALRDIGNMRDFARLTVVAGGPALVAFAAGTITTNLLVTGAIALSTNKSLIEVLRGNHKRGNVGIDFLVAPLVFVFAWVYAAFGAIAAATVWVPVLGFRQAHRTNLELEQTNEELLELMVKSLEARDPYTSGHSRRVQQFSTTIGRAIGLSDRQIDEVGRAALLHDVGKIYEKYAAVLSKQDKLTPEEWAIIRDHPEDGANLIATMTKLRALIPAVRHHHENWDGTGYPTGLTGDNIPLAARIIRFADTIDAMTSERPYRRPLTETQVRSELLRCRATQFDPGIADRLLASPLWPTLFAPASNDATIAPIVVVSAGHRRGGQPRGRKLQLGA